MNCPEVLKSLDAMLDDRSQNETTVAAFRHMEDCSSCQSVWTKTLAARERLHSLRERIEMPAALPAKIHSLISATASVSVASDLLRDDIKEVMAELSPRERDVLRLRFGLDDGKVRTLEEVGQLFGVTRERIRQIEADALRKLRHANRSRNQPDYVDGRGD